MNILRVLFNAPEDRGLSADSIAENLFPGRETMQKVEAAWKLTPAQIVIRALHDMAEARLIDRGVMLTVILRPKGKGNAMPVFQAVSGLEERLIALLQAEDPDADDGGWVELDAAPGGPEVEERRGGGQPTCGQGPRQRPFARRQGACRRPRQPRAEAPRPRPLPGAAATQLGGDQEDGAAAEETSLSSS